MARKRPREKPLLVGGIPAARFYSYGKTFFQKDLLVLQGITFPLKKQPFKRGNIHLNEDAKVLAALRRTMDTRNVSYVLE